MVVSVATNRNSYTGTGSLDTYPYTFRIFDESDIGVYKTDIAGSEVKLAINSDYTLDGVDDYAGGNVYLTNNLEAGYSLILLREMPYVQNDRYRNQGAFHPERHEETYDKSVMLSQQLKECFDRSLHLNKKSDGINTELPPPVASTVLGWSGDGLRIMNVAAPSAALQALITDSTNVANGDALVAVKQPYAGAVARTQHEKNQDYVSIKDFGAIGDWNVTTHTGTDDTAAFENAFSVSRLIHIPPGVYKISSSFTMLSGSSLIGQSGLDCKIVGYGCDIIQIADTSTNVSISNIAIKSYGSDNTENPRLYTGINALGVSAATAVYRVYLHNLNMFGFETAINLGYVWDSLIDNLKIEDCDNCIELFGQCVNNSISNSRLVSNGGNASIVLNADGSTIGEGLMVVNCLLASGDYGVTCDNGFLSLNISNCIIDLIIDTAFNIVDVRSSSIVGSWLYAANYGIKLNTIGAPVDLGFSISACNIVSTSATGYCIYIGTNNNGVNIVGGKMSCNGTGYGIYADSNNCSIYGVHFVNTGTSPSIFFVGSTCHVAGITGNNTVQYYTRANTPNFLHYGGGYQFPVTSVNSPDYKTLDDYEEGTFTPVIYGDSAAGTGTYSVQRGYYTKVGNIVFFNLVLAWSAHSGTGGFRISGFPYSIIAGSFPVCSVLSSDLTYSGELKAELLWLSATLTNMRLVSQSNGAATTDVAIDTSGTLKISGQYML